MQLDEEGKVVSTIEDETAVEFQAPRTRQATAKGDEPHVDEPQPGGSEPSSMRRRASAAPAVPYAAQVVEHQPGGSGISSRRRRASAAPAVPITAQVDEPQSCREPSQKKRRAGPLGQDESLSVFSFFVVRFLVLSSIF